MAPALSSLRWLSTARKAMDLRKAWVHSVARPKPTGVRSTPSRSKSAEKSLL
jgi:hypothetical protein